MNKKIKRQRVVHQNLDSGEDQKRRINARQFIADSCKIAKTLPARKRILFLLHYDHGYTNKEIAELCDCDEATVGRRLGKISDELNEKRALLQERATLQGRSGDAAEV